MAVRKLSPQPFQFRIQPMRLQDVEDVVALDARCFPTPWSPSAYVTEAHNPSAYYITAWAGDTIVGYAGLWLIMDEAHITTIGVHPDYRRRRIGERMLIDLLRHAISHSASRATLEVRRSNTAAQNLYVKYDFQTVAVRRAYYTNNNEDAFVMWAGDMQSPAYLQLLEDNAGAVEAEP